MDSIESKLDESVVLILTRQPSKPRSNHTPTSRSKRGVAWRRSRTTTSRRRYARNVAEGSILPHPNNNNNNVVGSHELIHHAILFPSHVSTIPPSTITLFMYPFFSSKECPLLKTDPHEGSKLPSCLRSSFDLWLQLFVL